MVWYLKLLKIFVCFSLTKERKGESERANRD